MALSPLLSVMVNAAMRAGRDLRHDFVELENLTATPAARRAFAEKSRQRVFDLLRKDLSRARSQWEVLDTPVIPDGRPPDDRPVASGSPARRWHILAIDGIDNFCKAVPLFSVWLTCSEGDEGKACVIYNPVTAELVSAERGRGAFCNDRRMRATRRPALDGSLIAVGPSQSRNLAGRADLRVGLEDVRCRLWRAQAAIHGTGAFSIDLAWTAAGRFDACVWGFATAPYSAAACTLLREAGGVVGAARAPDDAHSGFFVGGGAAIQKPLHSIVARAVLDCKTAAPRAAPHGRDIAQDAPR